MTNQETKSRTGILIAAGAAVVLVAAFFVALLLGPKTRQEPPETTAATEETTEATLPPPEANPYGPNDFQYDGDYLTCTAGESVLGIDISEFQTVTDWNAVRDAGVEFVILRAGYRGYSSGQLNIDEKAAEHYAGAKAAGLKVGVYFFSQAVTAAEAEAEACLTLNIIKDWQLDMPVVYDWEYVSDEARTADVTGEELTAITMAFCDVVEEAGYVPMVYFNQNQSFDLLQLEVLTDYGFWLAMYSDRMTYPYKLDMWQYTCEGAVPGIEGNVDLNLWFPET